MVTCHDSASCEDQTQAAKLSRYRVCHALVDELNVNNIAMANSTAIGFTAYPPGYSKAIMWLHAAGPTTDTLLQRMAGVSGESGLTLLRLLLLLLPGECGSRSQGSRRREGPNHRQVKLCFRLAYVNFSSSTDAQGQSLRVAAREDKYHE